MDCEREAREKASSASQIRWPIQWVSTLVTSFLPAARGELVGKWMSTDWDMDVDRVFVHALNTVKRIPKTGASRPPPPDRLRLYGLYKQAMEGDVDGVMERPMSIGEGEAEEEDVKKDRDKYDAWDSQRGLSKTEAKRRYIEALIETMHKYASTTA